MFLTMAPRRLACATASIPYRLIFCLQRILIPTLHHESRTMKSSLWAVVATLTGLLVYMSLFPVGQPAAAEVDMSELIIEDLQPGSGDAITAGQLAVVHYTGWLFDEGAEDNKGTKFDSSLDRGDPFSFKVGGGQVIRGWDLGVEGMRVGGERRLVIPASLAYGARGAGGVIPGGATLLFEVSLVEIR